MSSRKNWAATILLIMAVVGIVACVDAYMLKPKLEYTESVVDPTPDIVPEICKETVYLDAKIWNTTQKNTIAYVTNNNNYTVYNVTVTMSYEGVEYWAYGSTAGSNGRVREMAPYERIEFRRFIDDFCIDNLVVVEACAIRIVNQ